MRAIDVEQGVAFQISESWKKRLIFRVLHTHLKRERTDISTKGLVDRSCITIQQQNEKSSALHNQVTAVWQGTLKTGFPLRYSSWSWRNHRFVSNAQRFLEKQSLEKLGQTLFRKIEKLSRKSFSENKCCFVKILWTYIQRHKFVEY